MSLIDITIIIPVHSASNSLLNLFYSLNKQNCHNLKAEFIFIIDQCPENVFQFVQHWCISQEKHSWKCYAVSYGNSDQSREFGRQAAHGNILAFLDDDCRPCQDWLWTGWHMMISHSYLVAVTGPVLHQDNLIGTCLAVANFGEFQDNRIKFLKNAPGCNLFVRSSAIKSYPSIQECGYAGDRLLASQLAHQGKIAFIPTLNVFHDHGQTWKKIPMREFRYGQVAWLSRKIDPSLPGSRILNLGIIAPFVISTARFAIDIKRLWSGSWRLWHQCVLSLMFIPFRIAYGLGVWKSKFP
ncbi:MAG: glycosyltransferase family 2 protein [Desulfobacterales bacterium]|nr:glycosyltransferase family 2 protein [Desulfobacterales bacterium]